MFREQQKDFEFKLELVQLKLNLNRKWFETCFLQMCANDLELLVLTEKVDCVEKFYATFTVIP